MGSYEVYSDHTNSLLQDISYILDIPSFAADAFIYIFLQKRIRKKFLPKRKKYSPSLSSTTRQTTNIERMIILSFKSQKLQQKQYGEASPQWDFIIAYTFT